MHQKGGFFGGIQAFYRQNQHDAKLDGMIIIDENSTAISQTNVFGVKRKSIGVNLTAGFQKNFSHFLFEPSIGLGVMNRNIKNSSRDKEALENYESNGTDLVPFFDKLDLERSSGTAFNLSLSFKIGYNF